MGTFDVEVTTLRGEILATTRSDRAGTGVDGADPYVFSQYSGLEVAIPLSDTRTCKCTFPMEEQAGSTNPVAGFLKFQGVVDDDAEQHTIAALGRMLRVYYRRADNADPVFWGPVLMQTASFAAGTVEVNCVDQTFRLKHHYAHFGDDVVGPSGGPAVASPLDYTTVRLLVEAAENLVSQNNYPPLGIKIAGAFNDAPTAAGSTITIERGDNIWDRIVEIKDARYGPDIEFAPEEGLGDAGEDDLGGTWPFYCRLNTYQKQGQDQSADLTFLYDDDANANLSDVVWEPSGDQVRNEVKVITQPTDGGVSHRIFGHDLSAWKDVGIIADWQNPEGGNAGTSSVAALQDWANDYVGANARPPQFVSLTLRIEDALNPAASLPRYLYDFGLGDEVEVYAAKGSYIVNEIVRITQVTLTQLDASGNARTLLEVVPKVTNQANVTSGDDE